MFDRHSSNDSAASAPIARDNGGLVVGRDAALLVDAGINGGRTASVFERAGR